MGSQAYDYQLCSCASARRPKRVCRALFVNKYHYIVHAAARGAGAARPGLAVVTHHLAVAESFKTLNVEACDFYRTRPRGNSALTRDTLCWIALFAIGVPLAYLRYGTVLDKGTLGSLSNFGTTYGVAIMLIFHLLCVLAAFKDEISRGMLALVVPCYSFFYVFSMSDQYVVRVLLGLFLIAFGFETYEGFLGFVRSADVHIQSILGKT